MATYKASPHYEVANGNKSIKFDWLGSYETSDADEIKALDALVPTWIKRVDEVETKKPEVQTEKPATKPASKPKASAK